MKNIVFCGYRDWAKKLFKMLDFYDKSLVNLIYVDKNDDLSKTLKEHSPTYVFFVGWSWLIDNDIINNYNCICLHPSLLPKYRGGSPIQNQVIDGELNGGVTLFKMDEGIDTGDIIYQQEMSLKGTLDDIFRRIIIIGLYGIKQIISNNIKYTKQNEKEATFYKRRTPEMSEIKIEDFKNYSAKELYDKIRVLQNPYPNPFVVCKDGSKLFFEKVRFENEK